MQAAMDSCVAKTAMSGVMGFALGGAFGLFMSSVRTTPSSLVCLNFLLTYMPLKMSYDTPLSAQGQQMASLPLREQLRRGFRDMGSRSYASAKNFGKVGAIFAGTECCIESVGSPD